MGKGRLQDKSFHSPLSISFRLLDQWKEHVPEPFLSTMFSLKDAEDFRSQSKALKILTKQLKDFAARADLEDCKRDASAVFGAVFSTIENDSRQEKPTHLPAEFYCILRSLFTSVPSSIHKDALCIYLNDTSKLVNEQGHQYSTLQMLDVLLLHKVWNAPESFDGVSYYTILVEGCSCVLKYLYDQIIQAQNATDQSVIVQNSQKIECSLQILLRVCTKYKKELITDLEEVINAFTNDPTATAKETKQNHLCDLFSALISVLSLGEIQQESVTYAGLLLCQLLCYMEEQNENFLLEQIFVCFFPSFNDSVTKNKDQPNLLQFLSPNASETWNTLPIQSKIAVYRGLCITLPGKLLIRCMPSCLIGSSQVGDQKDKTLLFAAIFPAILDASRSVTVPLQKLIAFQSVKNACLKIFSMTNLTREKFEKQIDCETSSVTQVLLGVSPVFFFGSFYPKLVDVFWSTWEYHFDPVLKQLKDSFEVLVDIQQHVISISRNEEEIKAAREFMNSLISDMLRTDWNKRGKFPIFSNIFRAVGASRVFEYHPAFLAELFAMFAEPKYTGRSSSLLTNLVNNWNGSEGQNKTETKKTKKRNTKIKQSGLIPFDCLLPTFIKFLCSTDNAQQYGMVTYTIPIVIQTFPSKLRDIFQAISLAGDTTDNNKTITLKTHHMIALLSVVKHCRKQGILSSSDLENLITSSPEIPLRDVLHSGLTSGDALLRHTTLESICETRTLSEPLTTTETRLFQNFLRYCLRDALGTQGRQETGILLQKLLIRYKAHLRHSISAMSYENSPELSSTYQSFREFVNETTNQITMCLYPRSPFLKMSLALYLYNQLVLQVWNFAPPGTTLPKQKQTNKPSKTGICVTEFIPQEELSHLSFFDPMNLQTLLCGLWDSFEKTRELIFETLRKFPSPLPQLPLEAFRYYLQCAKKLICSSRARDGEIGAMLFRIVFSQYLSVLPAPCAEDFMLIIEEPACALQSSLELSIPITCGGATFRLFCELIYLLEQKIKFAQENEENLFSHRSMHGILGTIKHLAHDLRFNFSIEPENVLRWRELFSRLVNDLFIILTIAMNVIADMTTEGWNPSLSRVIDETKIQNETNIDLDDQDDCDDEDQGRQVIVASWLLIKSVSLLLGSLIKELPLQNSEDTGNYLLSNQQVQDAAEALLKVLLSTRHKGVLEKTYIGFESICNRLFESQITSLLQLPSQWIQILMKRITHIKTNIITRRSAGIPFAMCAILRAEASQSFSVHPYLTNVMEELLQLITGTYENQEDEMSVVHAFNVLRSILTDKLLGARVDPWIAEYFERTIDALSHPSWAIRNSASLSFSVLIRRTLGVSKRNIEERSRATITTFSILFSRLAPMYPFLLKKFTTLLEELESNDEQNSEESKSFITQTSLYSLLILLSRLSPSEHVLASNIRYTSAPFIPLVLKCSRHSDFRVREMAARSLVPLVNSNDVIDFIVSQINLLPQSESFSRTVIAPQGWNEVHGILLQVYYLYKENIIRFEESSELRDQLEVKLVPLIPQIFAFMFVDCLSVSKTFLALVYMIEDSLGFMKINNELIDTIRQQLIVASHCRQAENIFTWTPMRITWRTILTSFLCRMAINYSDLFESLTKETPTLYFVRVLSDNDYELRSEALDHLSASVDDMRLNWDILQCCIVTRVQVEANEEVLVKLLIVLRTIPRNLSPKLLSNDSEHWKRLHSLISSSPSSLIREQAIEYMGYFIHEQMREEQNSSPECFDFWLSQLEILAVASQPMESRMSVTCSIIHSDLLSKKSSQNFAGCADEIVRCWLLLAMLIEDDDEDIRNEVLQYLSFATELPSYSQMNKEKETQNNFRIETSLSPSIAKETIFLLLSQQYGQNMVYQQYLFDVVCGDISKENLSAWEADNKELFTKEPDNIWAEPLFVVHIAAYYLRKHIEDGSFNIQIDKELLILLLERFNELAISFANVSDSTILTIAPFADQTRFLYSNRLFIALACVASSKFENISQKAISLFFDSVQLFQSSSLLHPIAKHSLSFAISAINKHTLLPQSEIITENPNFFGIGLFYTSSF